MLEVRKLTKRYSAIPAVQDVSFSIRPGQILGYLGPNGSGKSTTVKMLTGLIEPSDGEIFFRGENVLKNRLWFSRHFGYVPEEPYLYAHLTGREYLQLAGRLRGMEKSQLELKIEAMLELFGLAEFRDTQMSSYSKGMRQKVLLSAALLHDPRVLILDEPFSGLDVTAALVFRSLLQALANEGKMILYSSHVLEVVEKVCSEVVILHRGRVLAYDSVARLRDLRASTSLEDVFSQLVMQEDVGAVASQMIAVMRA
ncbi:MAG TPA: ABC transporter ATP-binding protein [Terriglobales bacterium]|nr:ABC transporter ATP-binding protein [Terriglobales bacterium]